MLSSSPTRKVNRFSPSSSLTVIDHCPPVAVVCWSSPNETLRTTSAPSGADPVTVTVCSAVTVPSSGASMVSASAPIVGDALRPSSETTSADEQPAVASTTASASPVIATIDRMAPMLAGTYRAPVSPAAAGLGGRQP